MWQATDNQLVFEPLQVAFDLQYVWNYIGTDRQTPRTVILIDIQKMRVF
jgi:hypothetical protein